MQNQKELIQLIEKWENTEPMIYKTNIKNICEQQNKTSRDIEAYFNISFNTVRSFLNPSHPARIPFLMGLKLAEYLNINIENFLKNFVK